MTFGMKFDSIKKRLLFYSLAFMSIMFITVGNTFIIIENFTSEMNKMFADNHRLSHLLTNVEKVNYELFYYLSTKNTMSYDRYIMISSELKEEIGTIEKKPSYNKTELLFKDIANMTQSYLYLADKATKGRKNNNIEVYSTSYDEAKKIYEYIKIYINELNLNAFQNNNIRYTALSKNIEKLRIINSIIIIDSILLAALIIFALAKSISEPLKKLKEEAEEIAKGNLEVEDIHLSQYMEFQVVSKTFNSMKNNLKDSMAQISLKAEIEARLMEEKMNNLSMSNLLKNAQLTALQSQINPHFLFNTLNAGVQLANMEEAEKTSLFLEKLSHLFRYNLKHMDSFVCIKEELEYVNSYIYLLKTRFGDLIEFKTEVDDSILDTKIPAVTLQPLVENAFIHGLGDKEEGGQISIIIKKVKGYAQISVEDNGKGMKDYKQHIGHTTGIGLSNVVERLELYSDKKDVIEIISEPGEGTKINILLPLHEGEKHEAAHM